MPTTLPAHAPTPSTPAAVNPAAQNIISYNCRIKSCHRNIKSKWHANHKRQLRRNKTTPIMAR
ncbi:hypothetical protein OHAE_1785 [Ochrobactrum soli]|uniref:Uncharacterized protein n=1 Tax=Ochrobactrum soli TaxID=2448455 RepID=A0A2P9HP65_9HYPH|nr:hypothetical protein OHAE_1785 [[Ochrobactrum] soli]